MRNGLICNRGGFFLYHSELEDCVELYLGEDEDSELCMVVHKDYLPEIISTLKASLGRV